MPAKFIKITRLQKRSQLWVVKRGTWNSQNEHQQNDSAVSTWYLWTQMSARRIWKLKCLENNVHMQTPTTNGNAQEWNAGKGTNWSRLKFGNQLQINPMSSLGTFARESARNACRRIPTCPSEWVHRKLIALQRLHDEIRDNLQWTGPCIFQQYRNACNVRVSVRLLL